MYNWHLQRNINIIHDRFHYNRALLTPDQLAHPEYFVDHSCNYCYPSQLNSDPRYIAFWNWYRNNSSAYQNSQKTFESFIRLLNNNNIDLLRELHYLLFTTRFNQQEDPDTLIPLIINCFNYTQQFTQNLDRLNYLQNIVDNDFNTTDSKDNNENNIPDNLLDDMNY